MIRPGTLSSSWGSGCQDGHARQRGRWRAETGGVRNSQELATELSSPVTGSLRTSAVRGAAWTTAQSVVNRLSGLVVFLVLARLLAPAEFGLLAAANVFIVLAATFAEAGLTRTLVQRPLLRAAHLDSALIVSAGSGLLLAVALASAAPGIARLYDLPALTWVLVGLAIVPLLNGMSAVPDSILTRQLQFRYLAIRSSTSVVVAGVIGVVLAAMGAGVWALVAQALSQALVASAVLWICVRWRPSAAFEAGALKELVGFGSHILGIQCLNFLNRRSGDLLIGVFLGPVALGLYSVAQRVLHLVLDLLVSSVQRVALPVFSRLADEPARLSAAYLRSTEATTLAAFPCFALLVATGPDLTPVLFGTQWTSAGPVMSVLALAGAAQSIAFFNNSMLLATGNSWLALRWTAASAVANVAVFAGMVQFGIMAVAIGFTAGAWIMLPLGLFLVRRVSEVSLRQQLRTLGIPSLGCIGMVAVVLGGRLIWSGDEQQLGHLIVSSGCAGLVYVCIIGLLRRDIVAAVLGKLQRRRGLAVR